jgi:leader peptidase (prepilin peptidase)/N-methyltransferase
VMYVGLFLLYFMTDIRQMSTEETSGLQVFLHGGWLIFLLHIILLSGLLAISAIDLELWVVPLSACWFLTAVGVAGSALASFVMDIKAIGYFQLLPLSGATSGAVSSGAAIGLVISLILLRFGFLKESYIGQDAAAVANAPEPHYNHRLEVLKEVLFLVPVLACSIAAYYLLIKVPAANARWLDIMQFSIPSGFLGALTGYFVGAAIVWTTRIFGTLGFGKEAMGMGDVHLMGAAGAFIGPIPIIVAFFIAPFFGLAWAIFQMLSKKTRQIPYVPFLSLGILTVMIFHNWIFQHLRVLMVR